MKLSTLLTALLPLALMFGGSGALRGQEAAVPAVPAKSETPLFPGNKQFWFETQRAFGAASYASGRIGRRW